MYIPKRARQLAMQRELRALGTLMDGMRLPAPLRRPLRRVDSDLVPHPSTPCLLRGEGCDGRHRREQSLPAAPPPAGTKDRNRSAAPVRPRGPARQTLLLVAPSVGQDPRQQQARRRREALDAEKRARLRLR